MATTTLEMDLLPLMEPIIEILDRYGAVKQQQVIELLAVRHANRMPSQANFILASMFKHIYQLNRQWQEYWASYG